MGSSIFKHQSLVKLLLGIFLVVFNYKALADGYRILLSNDDGMDATVL